MRSDQTDLQIKTYLQIANIGAEVWDQLGTFQAFQGYRWYAYAERAMAGCRPFYILVFENQKLVGRAAFYLVPNEPIPVKSRFLRIFSSIFFRRWPLFICRSPFSGLPGLVLAETDSRGKILSEIGSACLTQARQWKSSFVFFDFIEQESSGQWPSPFRSISMSDPGTVLDMRWTDFETYLAHLGKDERYHYRRVQRKAQELGILVERHRTVPNVEQALALIQNVERKFDADPFPWTRTMLENLDGIDAIWITASVAGRLVGCGLTLRDRDGQLDTALGLADDVPYVYFSLLYESLKIAFESGVDSLRLGSGAYEVKHRLGSRLETNNAIVVASPSVILQKVLEVMA